MEIYEKAVTTELLYLLFLSRTPRPGAVNNEWRSPSEYIFLFLTNEHIVRLRVMTENNAIMKLNTRVET